MPSLARSALWYADHGWRVFPCLPREKRPAIEQWQRRATADVLTVERWWRARPDCNIGVACGPDTGVYVVDVDRHGEDGEATLRRVLRKLGPLPETVEQRTGSGGRQLLFAYPEGRTCRNTAGSRRGLGGGVDTRGEGGFVVVPPSIHPCGDAYRWTTGPHQAPLAPLPDAWVDRLERKERITIRVPLPPSPAADAMGATVADRRIEAVARAAPGKRNDELYRAAFYLARLGRDGLVDWPGVRRRLEWAGTAAGLTDDEVRRTIGSAQRGAWEGA